VIILTKGTVLCGGGDFVCRDEDFVIFFSTQCLFRNILFVPNKFLHVFLGRL